jgi:prolyl 4-hydroxylase
VRIAAGQSHSGSGSQYWHDRRLLARRNVRVRRFVKLPAFGQHPLDGWMGKNPDIEALKRDARAGHAAAEYNLGVWHLIDGDGAPDPEAARELFETSAAKGFAPAMSALGFMRLRGQGFDVDHASAAEWFRQAAAGGSPDAGYRLAGLLASGCGVDADLEAARAALGDAARKGLPAAMGELAYCLANGIGGDRDGLEAAAWYQRAALAGDPRSQCRLASALEEDEMLPADATSALAWYLRAANAGYGDAASAVRRLSNDLQAEQVEEAGRMARSTGEESPDLRPAEAVAPPVMEVICWSPRIFRFRGLLSDEECHHLIAAARPFLRRAMVLDRSSGERVHDPARRSMNARLADPLRDVVACTVESRLARCSLLPLENAEPISILCYRPGDEYRPHADYYDPARPGSATGLALGGQRIATFLGYLNDVASGGATAFPMIEVSIAPKRGDGLLFFNCLPDGSPDRRTLHAGLPVEAGEKWLLSRWIRADAYPADR